VKRIAIIGSGGSGKSTLARQIGERLGIEVIHLDALFWRPGWVETPREEWRLRQAELVQRESWVMDGNYGGTLDIRLAAADTIIFLDLPRLVCLRRVVLRALRYAGRSRPDMAPGCEERLSWPFFRWVWEYPSSRRPGILHMLEMYAPGRRIVRLRSSQDVRSFVASLREGLP
jgi:adenylate kinase family enzyme